MIDHAVTTGHDIESITQPGGTDSDNAANESET